MARIMVRTRAGMVCLLTKLHAGLRLNGLFEDLLA